METQLNTILIVDDTPKNLQVLGNTLKQENYKIEFAIDGKSALDWLTKKDFDIILLDVMMPEMDGYEVCETIRNGKFQAEIPIIFLTARTDTESTVKGFELGAQDYITKPFRLKELEIRIMKWFKSYCISTMFSQSNIIKYKKLIYKFDTNDFHYKDQKIKLTKKSKFILFQLLLKAEKLITEDVLKEKLWSDREKLKIRNLRVNILRLKQSLEEVGISSWVHNKR